MEGISKAATVLSVLMKVYTIAWNDRGHINVLLVLQSCTDPLQVLSGSSGGTYDVGNIKFKEEMEMKEEEEVNMKAEKEIGSEEEECVDIQVEDGMYCEEEEEDPDVEEELNIDIKEEVCWKDTV